MKQTNRLTVYAPNGAVRGSVSLPSSYSLSTPINDVSAMTLDIVDEMLGWEHLTDHAEVAYEYSLNGFDWIEPPNARFVKIGESFNAVGDAHVSRSYTLPGYAWLLQTACNMQVTNLNADGKRSFLSKTPGFILHAMITEAKARGSLPGFSIDFSATHDSAGQPWSNVLTIYYSPGIDYLTLLRNLSDTGACDWQVTGRVLQLFNVPGENPPAKNVNLEPGRDIIGLPVTSSLENIVHRMMIVGDEAKALTKTRTTAPQPWGLFESALSQGSVSDDITMNMMLDNALEAGSRPKTQYTVELDALRTKYEVFHDYRSGDYITSVGNDGNREAFRVRNINVSRSESGELKISLILNDRFLEREIITSRRVTGITNGARSSGGIGTPSPPKPVDDTRLPARPTGVVISSSAQVLDSGRVQGVVSLAWAEVTKSTTGEDIDVDHYDIFSAPRPYGQATPVPFNQMVKVGEAIDTSAVFGYFNPGTTHDYAVIAVVQPGYRRSAASATVSVVIVDDNEPPAKLSPPTATSDAGIVMVRHDGKSATGAEQPPDWQSTIIYRSGSADPAGVILDRNGGYIYDAAVSALERGQQYTYYAVAVDNSGNRSVQSELSEPVTFVSVLDDTEYQQDMDDLSDALAARDAMIAAIQDDVDEARADATTALTSADGRNSRIVSTGDPSGETNPRTGQPWVEGDTWRKWDSTVTRNVIGAWAYRNGEWVAEMIGGVIIKDGSVTAEKVSADLSMANRFAGLMATFGEAFIGKVKADYVASGAFTGKVFTGGTFTGTEFRTGLSNPRVILNSDGLRAYDATGSRTVNISGSTGFISGFSITGTNISGGTLTGNTITGNTISGGTISGGAITGGTITGAIIRSSTSGTRIQIDNENLGGRLRYLDSYGYSRVAMEVNAGGGYLSFYANSGREMLKVSEADGLTIDQSTIVMNSTRFVGDWTSQVSLASPVHNLRCSDVRLGYANGNYGLFWKLRYAQAGPTSAPVYAAIWEYEGGPSRMPPITGGFPLAMSANSGGTGTVCVTTSARRAKADIRDIGVDPYRILDVRPRDWLDRAALEADPTLTTRTPGVVAEEVEDAGLSEFVSYYNDQVQGVMYDRLPVLFIPIIKDLIKRIETLEGARNG